MELEKVIPAITLLAAAYVNLLNVACAVRRRRRRVHRRRWWVHPVWRTRETHGAFNTLFRELKLTDEEQFARYSRMNVNQFNQLHQLIEPILRKRSIRTPLPSELRLAATLSFLADGGSVQSKSWQFRVGRSTMFKIIKETCQAIVDSLQPQYLQTLKKTEWLDISEGFWNNWNFPNCLGAIDGKHIRIKAPPKSGTLYHNEKGFFSFVLLAACDHKYRFTSLDIGEYGSHNDAEILASSAFGRDLASGNVDIPPAQSLPNSNQVAHFSFVGDDAFSLKTHLMRPYARRNISSDRERIFNYRLSCARRVIENAFGVLVARWRVLSAPLCFKVETVESIIFALCCLHNFLITDEDQRERRFYNPREFVDRVGPDGGIIPGEWRAANLGLGNFGNLGQVGDNFSDSAAQDQRELLANYFVSPEGSVEWQDKYV